MQFIMGCLAGWSMGWFPAFTAHETRNERKHRESLLPTDPKPSFGKKLLSCFAFAMTTVFTDKDSVNSLCSSDENLGIKISALRDRGMDGVPPLRSTGMCMREVAWEHASVFGASVGK